MKRVGRIENNESLASVEHLTMLSWHQIMNTVGGKYINQRSSYAVIHFCS